MLLIVNIVKSWIRVENQEVRDRWVAKQLQSIPAGSRILDAGCGTQPYRNYCQHLEYRAQDFGVYDGRGDGKFMQTAEFHYGPLDYVGDIWNIAESDETFDVILCTEVLEHVPYAERTLAEFTRLLRPGGILLLTAPFCCIPHMSPYYFTSGYSREFYEHCFQKYGLVTQELTENGNAFAYLLQEILRARLKVQNPLYQIAYMMSLITIAPLLKLFSSADFSASANYLHFGFHIRAEKSFRAKSNVSP